MTGPVARALDLVRAAARRLGLAPPAAPVNPHFARWFRDGGDRTLRLDYDLGPGSIVFDVGGYTGQWASDIHAMYGCTVHVFEPVPAFADAIARRFARNPRIVVHPFGLGASNGEIALAVDADRSSAFRDGGTAVTGRIVAAADFLASGDFPRVDLLKVNIEGGEYDLLEHLLREGLMGRFQDVQVQFHDFFPEAAARRERIQAGLAASHALTWEYPFVWENWRRKA